MKTFKNLWKSKNQWNSKKINNNLQGAKKTDENQSLHDFHEIHDFWKNQQFHELREIHEKICNKCAPLANSNVEGEQVTKVGVPSKIGRVNLPNGRVPPPQENRAHKISEWNL